MRDITDLLETLEKYKDRANKSCELVRELTWEKVAGIYLELYGGRIA